MSTKLRFLVTGGAGFIGSHIVKRLLKEGHFVRVLDNFSSGKEENLPYNSHYITPYRPSLRGANSPRHCEELEGERSDRGRNARGNAEPNWARPISNFQLIRGDIRSYPTCLTACEDIDYILHQAALRSVPKSMESPHEYNDVNIDGTLNMLRAAREKKVKRFVLASSSSIYGDPDKFPEKEDFLPQLISPYALTKLAGEHYCRIFSEHYNLETVCLRYFNVFGPRQALDDEYAVVIPKFITCILTDEQPPIFGTGLQSRDFTYIDNVVEANILSAVTPGIKHEVFNVANGKDHTVLQIVEILNKIVGKNIQPKLLPLRQGDVFKTLADITKIKTILRFQPKVNFKSGLEKTVEWFDRHSLLAVGA